MAVAQFAREYTTVRRAEGWGSRDSAYYQALPFQDLTGRFSGIWRIRARSYATFVARVLEPLEHVCGTGHVAAPLSRPVVESRRRLRILDLGAGNGWLANRLAGRGHLVTAVDLLDDPLDGLGAARHYGAVFAPVVAEFDHLPLADAQVDLAVFNASLHYSTDYASTLQETLRVLQPHGTLVFLDSPMYSDPSSGARMVQERQSRFRASYGFASDALPSEHFLTPARLDELGEKLQLSWQVYQPALDWRTRLERKVGSLRARREAARFPVIVGRCP